MGLPAYEWGPHFTHFFGGGIYLTQPTFQPSLLTSNSRGNLIPQLSLLERMDCLHRSAIGPNLERWLLGSAIYLMFNSWLDNVTPN